MTADIDAVVRDALKELRRRGWNKAEHKTDIFVSSEVYSRLASDCTGLRDTPPYRYGCPVIEDERLPEGHIVIADQTAVEENALRYPSAIEVREIDLYQNSCGESVPGMA